MITASGVELRAGAELLLSGASFRVGPGDRIGLVGRNGAGKTTLMRTLARERGPVEGSVTSSGSVGYLPQDPAEGDLSIQAMDRILSSRGLDRILARMDQAQTLMTSTDADEMTRGIDLYAKQEARFMAAGGYGAKAEAARIAANLGLEDRVLSQDLATLSGGQRRRVELARILFQGADVLLLDEPTNHLDQDSVVWLRDFLRSYGGGFMVISHDSALLADTVNKVWHLDANRRQLDQYNLGWSAYLAQRELDERRRKRERTNAEKKAQALTAQANRMRAKATKAVAAQNMLKRAERLIDGTEGEATRDKVAAIRFPDPAPSGKVPLTAEGLSKSYGSLEVFTDVDLAIDRGSRVVVLGLNGAGKTTLLRLLAGLEDSDSGNVLAGHGLQLGYYAQEHETLDLGRTVLENMAAAAPDMETTEVRKVLGSFLFSGDSVMKPARVLSGGEKTRLALATLVVSAANVLLLDEPTNNLDPASRLEILAALSKVKAAVVLVTHDSGAVRALSPDRVLLLPDGDEDLWSSDYEDLIELA
ncbi:MAG: ATP-binding cassette domain-containing protein [Bifidobacteriaceae bacterium]|nr:ATP-binding cassette domain-containing protein [Bifidobacteriaceae bacterium]